ncbi:TPA: hypothetical protein HIT98_003912 [Escherichia coli]|uniref:hypothetical protein n=1 Tax=Escherichia TaxID=561 RepID=UPI000CF78DA1|nr:MULTISPECIES: hypothetical protein [unclassified Escherichia]EES2025395.1 hypothetical protein [Escherichia coli]EFB2841786.1 hypothetical protein [Escherichia coli]EIY6704458.1 hypothetical protein [Escherichia coli]MBB2341774.1 hypothetical protein [Escherichia sp. 93.0750]MCF7291819.1 hypothetical protein [Escherichia coli]
MTNYTDNQNYVRAVLAGIGIDFDETQMIINVSPCQGDEVSFSCSISASELRHSVDHYVDTLNDTQLDGLEANTLKKLLAYFLEVFDQVSGQYLDIAGKHYATSRFEYDDVCSDVLSLSADSTQPGGYDREEYKRLMEVDGQVLIARFALELFWNTHFIGLINYVSDEITSRLYEAYRTFSDISMAAYTFSDYSYSRRISDELSLHISLQEDDFEDQLTDCYMDETTLPSGKVVLRRNNESIIDIYESYAAKSYFHMVACVRVLDLDGEVVTELYQGVNVSELAGGRIKIHDRQDLIYEVFTNLRELIPASEVKISVAA